MSDSIAIVQFHGCEKCFNETLALEENLADGVKIQRFSTEDKVPGKKFDKIVITGYLLPEDESRVKELASQSDMLVAYGNCSSTGGVFGLAYQKGIEISPIGKFKVDVKNIEGCLGEIEELVSILKEKPEQKLKNLCKSCKRKSTCNYLDEVQRQISPMEDEESCYNDLGFLCNGYVARDCKERCIDYGAPCRGCKSNIDRPGFRMMGLFGTLLGNVEVATEQAPYGATDKLADVDDDVSRGVMDVTGKFFLHHLANSILPIGRNQSSGNVFEDIMIGRLIEEIPVIAGFAGGNRSISLVLDIIEAYENNVDNGFEISSKTKDYRKELRNLEGQFRSSIDNQDSKVYSDVWNKICLISGNKNLSNVFFGGFRTPIKGNDNFSDYQSQIFEIKPGTYASGMVKYTIDEDGVVTAFHLEGK